MIVNMVITVNYYSIEKSDYVSNFFDLSNYTPEEKHKLIYERYRSYFKLISKKSPIIDKVIALNNNSKPNPEKLAVIEGIWALTLGITHSLRIKHFIVCPEKIKSIESQKLIEDYINISESSYIVSERTYDYISEKGNSSGITAVCYMPTHSLYDIHPRRNSIVLILDGLEIPGNVGTILRSCDATDIDGVIITNKKTRLNHPKLIRSSMGSCFTLPIIESSYDEAIKWLNHNKYNVVLTDTDAPLSYYDFNYKNRIAIVIGSEKYGISEEWYKTNYTGISIPMLGYCDSLNVGIAATIVLYEATLKNKELLLNRA